MSKNYLVECGELNESEMELVMAGCTSIEVQEYFLEREAESSEEAQKRLEELKAFQRKIP